MSEPRFPLSDYMALLEQMRNLCARFSEEQAKDQSAIVVANRQIESLTAENKRLNAKLDAVLVPNPIAD